MKHKQKLQNTLTMTTLDQKMYEEGFIKVTEVLLANNFPWALQDLSLLSLLGENKIEYKLIVDQETPTDISNFKSLVPYQKREIKTLYLSINDLSKLETIYGQRFYDEKFLFDNYMSFVDSMEPVRRILKNYV